MIQKTLSCLFFVLLAFLLTGCGAGSVVRKYHGDTMESAAVNGYVGSFIREVSASEGESIDFQVRLSALDGHILISIVDCDGKACLSLNERATLDEDQSMRVTVPTAGCPYTLRIDMERFTGEYEISFAERTMRHP